jgi:tight adherence protein C
LDAVGLFAAILVGASAGVLGYLLLRELDRLWLRRRFTDTKGPQALRSERLLPALRLVSVPGWIQRRWAVSYTQQRLTHAGLPWDPEAFAALRWALLWLAVAAAVGVATWRGWDLMGQFLALALVTSGVIGPGLWLSLQVERRQAEIDLALPDFLDRLALGLEAGLGFEVALRRTAVNFPGHLGGELRRLVRQLDRGHHRASALEEVVKRNPSQDLRAFMAAVKQSDRLGTSLAKALRVQTSVLRARRRRRAQEASRRLPILIVFPLVLCFLPALLIVYLAPPLLHLFLAR